MEGMQSLQLIRVRPDDPVIVLVTAHVHPPHLHLRRHRDCAIEASWRWHYKAADFREAVARYAVDKALSLLEADPTAHAEARTRLDCEYLAFVGGP